MKSSLVRTVLLVAPMLLAACGGGGGGGGDGGSTATGLVITTNNASAVAAEALEVSTNTDAAAAGGGFVTAVQVSGSGVANPMRLAKAARQLVAKARGSGTLPTGVATTEDCTLGGNVTFDVNTSGSGALTAGDSYAMTYNNCAEGEPGNTIVMNGSISISILSGSLDPTSTVYPKSFTMRIVASNYTVSGTGVESEAFNGDLTMTLTETDEYTASVTLTANSLTSTIGTHTVTVSNYSLSVTEGVSDSTMDVDATVQTNNSRLGTGPVRYTITTLTPLTVSSTGVVTAGRIKVTGEHSALLLTVTDPDTFSLQVDTDGDSDYDTTITVTHYELQALN